MQESALPDELTINGKTVTFTFQASTKVAAHRSGPNLALFSQVPSCVVSRPW
jgi:hypothetical protein